MSSVTVENLQTCSSAGRGHTNGIVRSLGFMGARTPGFIREPRMTGLLAIDQATVTGWAFCVPGGEPTWGHARMGPPNAWEGSVFWEFRRFVQDLIQALTPEYLVYETPFTPRPHSQPGAAVLDPDVLARAYGFCAHITALAQEYGLGCERINSRQATKFLTGKGQFDGGTVAERRAAKKDATVTACNARGWQVTNDEADALALLMCAEHKLYPAVALTRRKVLRQPTGPLFRDGYWAGTLP